MLCVDGGARARRLVAAGRRLSLGKALYGATRRWARRRWYPALCSAPVAAALADMPFVAARTAGAPERPLLLDVVDLLADRPLATAVPQAVMYRYSAQAALEELETRPSKRARV